MRFKNVINISLALTLFIWSAWVNAAAYTCSQSGATNVSSTWGGAGVPGSGDTAVCNAAYALTVPANQTIGTLPGSASNVFQCTGGCSLTVAADVTLTIRGQMYIGGTGTFTFNEGSSFVTETTAGIIYEHQWGVATDTGGIYFLGEEDNHCTITQTGAGRAWIDLYASGTNLFDFEAHYTDFLSLFGTGTQTSVRYRHGGFICLNCLFDGCAIVTQGGSTTDTEDSINVENCTFINGTADYDFYMARSTARDTGDVSQVKNCVFTRPVQLFQARGFTFDGNSFHGTLSHTPGGYTSAELPELWQNNFVDITAGDRLLSMSEFKNEYRLNGSDNVGRDNAHFWPISQNLSQTIDGCISEGAPWTTNDSDGVLILNNPASLMTYTIKNSIILPSFDGVKNSSTLLTDAQMGTSATNARYRVNNNTVYTGTSGAIYASVHNESSYAQAGQLEYVKNNIFWALPTSDNESWAIWDDRPNSSPPDDYLTSMTYNIIAPTTTFWKDSTGEDNNPWSDAVECNTTLVAVSSGGAEDVNRSTDGGLSWSGVSGPDFNYRAIDYSPSQGRLVVAASNPTTYHFMTSDDCGATWTSRSAYEPVAFYAVKRVDALNRWVAIGYDGGATSRGQYSTDGITWTPTNLSSLYQWLDLEYSATEGQFVAVGSSRIAYSGDGISWTDFALTGTWREIARSEELDLWVIVGYSGRIGYSSDGLNWTTFYGPSSNNWESVDWSPTRRMFAAVSYNTGTDDRSMFSKTGKNWILADTEDDNTFYGIRWMPNAGVFVALASTGTDTRLKISSGLGTQVLESAWATSPSSATNTVLEPRFVDSTRNLANWARKVLGQTGTDDEMRTYAINAFKDRNRLGATYYHTGVTIKAFMDWIKQGFQPKTHSAAHGGENGTYIGAVRPTFTESSSLKNY